MPCGFEGAILRPFFPVPALRAMPGIPIGDIQAAIDGWRERAPSAGGAAAAAAWRFAPLP
jgi:hypothetical protein